MTGPASNDDDSLSQALLTRPVFRAALARLVDDCGNRRIVEEELTAALAKVRRPAHRPARELWPKLAYWYEISRGVYPNTTYRSAAADFKRVHDDPRSLDTIEGAMKRAVRKQKAETNAE